MTPPNPNISEEARECAKKISDWEEQQYGKISSGYAGPSKTAEVNWLAALIQSALTAEADRVRRETVEEAAAIVERYRQSVLEHSSSITIAELLEVREAAAQGLQDVSVAIRSLIPKPEKP